MESVYITGSSGFIGSHLASKLERFTPIPHAKIDTIKLDPFDKFFFLSTYGNLYHQQETDQIVKANVSDLVRVLGQIDFNRGFKSFVYVSSSSVRLRRQTMYSRTKKAAEEILLSYMEKYNVPIAIVRPYSVTGVGEQPEHLIPKLIDSCLSGTQMDFVPRPMHDFIDVDDVVSGLLNLSNYSARGVFELGTGEGVSNQGVLEIVEDITGKKANVRNVDSLRDYDNEEWVSGNFKARMYGWLPKKTLDRSVREMVEAKKNES